MAVSSDATSDAEATAYEGRADSRSSESARSGEAGLLLFLATKRRTSRGAGSVNCAPPMVPSFADTEETRRAIAAWVGRR